MNRREHYRTEEDTKPLQDEKSVDLSSKALSTFPDTIATPSKVIDLNLSFNVLEAIPNQLQSFSSLKILNLNNNSIRIIPTFIQKLNFLEELSLAYNNIQKIPAFIGSMQLLKKLNLSYNQIYDLQPSLSQLSLNVLLISNNYFTTIPISYKKMILGLELLQLDWFLYLYPKTEPNLYLNKKKVLKSLLQLLFEKSEQSKKDVTFLAFIFEFCQNDFFVKKQNIKNQNILFDCIANDSYGPLQAFSINYRDLLFQQDNEQQYPITYAYLNKKQAAFQILLQYYEYEEPVLNKLFLLSVRQGDLQTIKRVLEKGANINHQAPKTFDNIKAGQTALHVAFSNFSKLGKAINIFDLCQYLLKKNINTRIKCIEKYTALHLLVMQPSLQAIKFAILYNKKFPKTFNFNKKGGSKKWTLLHFAANAGYINIIQILSEVNYFYHFSFFKININIFEQDFYNRTPKQVCIPSLLVVKFVRLMELKFLEQKILRNDEEEQQNEEGKQMIPQNFRKIAYVSCQQRKHLFTETEENEQDDDELDKPTKPFIMSIKPKQAKQLQQTISKQIIKWQSNEYDVILKLIILYKENDFGGVMPLITQAICQNKRANDILEKLQQILNSSNEYCIFQRLIVIQMMHLIKLKAKNGNYQFVSEVTYAAYLFINQIQEQKDSLQLKDYNEDYNFRSLLQDLKQENLEINQISSNDGKNAQTKNLNNFYDRYMEMIMRRNINHQDLQRQRQVSYTNRCLLFDYENLQQKKVSQQINNRQRTYSEQIKSISQEKSRLHKQKFRMTGVQAQKIGDMGHKIK